MSARCIAAICASLLSIATLASPARGQQAPALGRFVLADGVQVYFEESGRGAPLLLLHQFGGTSASWAGFVRSFAQRYRVLAVDLPGHGRSEPMDTSIVFRHDRVAEIMLALLDSLRLDSVRLVGISSGGIAALYMASMAPTRFCHLIVVAGQVYTSDEVLEAFARRGPDSANAEAMANLTARHGGVRAMQLARQLWHFRNLRLDPPITPDRLGRISARTLIIHGDNDFVPVAQAWEMFTNIPGARLWVVANGGHLPIWRTENREDATRRTLAFLNDEWLRR